MAIYRWLFTATLLVSTFLVAPQSSLAQSTDPIATRLGLTPDNGVLPPWTKPETESERQLGGFVRNSMPGIVLLGYPGNVTGTGFVISQEHRLIATNAHVADIAHLANGKMKVVLNNTSTEYEVEKIWYHLGLLRVVESKDKKRHLIRSMSPAAGDVYPFLPDVAVVRLSQDGPELPFEFELATPDEVDSVFAQSIAMAGYPAHDTRGWPQKGKRVFAAFHTGVISRVSGFDLQPTADLDRAQLIQHTAANWFGFSGSPLFLDNGHAIGLNNAIRKEEGKGYAVNIAHGIRLDCLWELLAFHKLDDMIPLPVDNEQLAIHRFGERQSPPDLQRSKEFTEAIQNIRIAYTLNPMSGFFGFGASSFESAADYATKAIEASPGFQPAYIERSKIFLDYVWLYGGQLGDDDKREKLKYAIKDALKAIKLIPTDMRPILMAADAMSQLAMRTPPSQANDKKEMLATATKLVDHSKQFVNQSIRRDVWLSIPAQKRLSRLRSMLTDPKATGQDWELYKSHISQGHPYVKMNVDGRIYYLLDYEEIEFILSEQAKNYELPYILHRIGGGRSLSPPVITHRREQNT